MDCRRRPLDARVKRGLMTFAGIVVLLPLLVVGWSTLQRSNVCFSDGNPYVEWQGDSCQPGWVAPELVDYFWPPEHWPWNARVCHPRMDQLADGSTPCPQ